MRDDCQNHVADRVAVGQVNFDIDCQFEFRLIQAEDIMHALNTAQSLRLRMKYEPTPILAGVQHQIGNWRLVKYLRERDRYSEELTL